MSNSSMQSDLVRAQANESRIEFRKLHQPGPASCPRLVGRLLPPRLVPRQLKGERCLPMSGAWPAMAAVPAPKGVGTPDIKMRVAFAKKINAGHRHIDRKLAIPERGHFQELRQFWRKRLNECGKLPVHAQAPSSAGISVRQENARMPDQCNP